MNYAKTKKSFPEFLGKISFTLTFVHFATKVYKHSVIVPLLSGSIQKSTTTLKDILLDNNVE